MKFYSNYRVMVLLCLLSLGGCASSTAKSSTNGPQAPGESRQDVVSAMEQVVGAVSGKDVKEQDLRSLNQQMQKDPQAKSAMQTITRSVSGQGQVVKYCPIDGERYSPKFDSCPVHKVPLKILDQ